MMQRRTNRAEYEQIVAAGRLAAKENGHVYSEYLEPQFTPSGDLAYAVICHKINGVPYAWLKSYENVGPKYYV